MSRNNEEITAQIKDLLETKVQAAVASHGGQINFVSYQQGHVLLELSGACSGCAGSTATLKYGVENMIKHYVPEVVSVDAVHDANSDVTPYYSTPSQEENNNVINIKKV